MPLHVRMSLTHLIIVQKIRIHDIANLRASETHTPPRDSCSLFGRKVPEKLRIELVLLITNSR